MTGTHAPELAPLPGASAPTSAAATSRSKPQLLFFYSPTSGRSRRVEGFVAQVLQRRHNHQSFVLRRIDADRNPDLAERFHVDQLPTLIVVAEKKVQARIEVPRGCVEISSALAPWLS